MKRSEMLVLIGNKVNKVIEKNLQGETMSLLLIAEDLLNNVEEAGMLPPLQDHIYPRLFKRDNEYVNIDSLKWESEDD